MFYKKRSEASNIIKKETLAQVFSCTFCEVFKNTYFEEHLRMAASEYLSPYHTVHFADSKTCCLGNKRYPSMKVFSIFNGSLAGEANTCNNRTLSSLTIFQFLHLKFFMTSNIGNFIQKVRTG